MRGRSKRSSVVFRHPATLEGIDDELPAEAYAIEVDEEQIAHLSFVAYRRVQTTIAIPIDRGGMPAGKSW